LAAIRASPSTLRKSNSPFVIWRFTAFHIELLTYSTVQFEYSAVGRHPHSSEQKRWQNGQVLALVLLLLSLRQRFLVG
jgi:hypothetical protein